MAIQSIMEDASQSLAAWSYGIAAVAYFAFAVQLWFGWRGNVRGSFVLWAAGLSACWALAVTAAIWFGFPWLYKFSFGADVVRIGAWLMLLLSLLHFPGVLRAYPSWREMLKRRGVGIVAFVLVMNVASLGAASYWQIGANITRTLLFASQLALAVAGLVVVEQLIRNIPEHARWGLKPLCVALGCVFGFDLYLYADAFLFKILNNDVWAVRGLVNALAIPFVAVTVARNRDWTLEIAVSRRVVFHSTTLLGAGVYLLAIAAAGYYVRYFGGNWGKALQAVFLFLALLLFVVIAFSGSIRSKLRVFLSKHFFSYRYDYREEWLKFTRALSATDPQLNFQQLTIKALADLVESPGGALWCVGSGQGLVQVARWNMPESPFSESEEGMFVKFLQESGWVVQLDADASSTDATFALGVEIPSWLTNYPNAWLAIPLDTAERFIGFVVLARPRVNLDVNWEVLDLLKTAGRQAASYLAQMLAVEALLEANKFDAFNRMSAFVVHDIKNLVAQLSLLLKNAERHCNNPEFQQDMLETIDHVVERMRHLLLQLRAGAQPVDRPQLVELRGVVRRVQQSKANTNLTVKIEVEQDMFSVCHADRIERVIGHLVQNALEATAPGGSVWIKLAQEGRYALIEVGDTGHGMTQEFVRERLFKPFQSTKQAGMGIGAYESQQYVTEVGGKIVVESQFGMGSIFKVLLPSHCADSHANEIRQEVA